MAVLVRLVSLHIEVIISHTSDMHHEVLRGTH
jgi:hypothetical protein